MKSIGKSSVVVIYALSNYFWNGELLFGVNGGKHFVKGGPVNKDFHTYAIDWSPNAMVWKIDGEVVRVVKKEDTFKDGQFKFPSHPSFVQIGIWDGSGRSDTSAWTNGPIDWNSLPNMLTTRITQVKISCDPKFNVIV